ncbi:MAG: hypothetical protein U0931_23325 [Vulcanimicrobiota bacterium]
MAAEAAATTMTAAALIASTTVVTAVVAVHLVVSARLARFAMLTVASIIVVVALAGEVTAFLEFRQGRHFLRTDREENAAEEDSLHAVHGGQNIIVQQHSFFEHQMGNALASRIHHHEAQPSNFFTFFAVDGTADV